MFRPVEQSHSLFLPVEPIEEATTREHNTRTDHDLLIDHDLDRLVPHLP